MRARQLANAQPKTEAEFEAFAEARRVARARRAGGRLVRCAADDVAASQSVAKLATKHQNSFHYMRLVKTLVKHCTVSFKSEEYKVRCRTRSAGAASGRSRLAAQDLSAHIGVLLNAQLAKEKKADGKKTKKGQHARSRSLFVVHTAVRRPSPPLPRSDAGRRQKQKNARGGLCRERQIC